MLRDLHEACATTHMRGYANFSYADKIWARIVRSLAQRLPALSCSARSGRVRRDNMSIPACAIIALIGECFRRNGSRYCLLTPHHP